MPRKPSRCRSPPRVWPGSQATFHTVPKPASHLQIPCQMLEHQRTQQESVSRRADQTGLRAPVFLTFLRLACPVLIFLLLISTHSFCGMDTELRAFLLSYIPRSFLFSETRLHLNFQSSCSQSTGTVPPCLAQHRSNESYQLTPSRKQVLGHPHTQDS